MTALPTDLPSFFTPLIGNKEECDFDVVYEPAEDSFLMLDMLEKDFHFLDKLRPTLCLEVGCGSGICITFLSRILRGHGIFLCTDINPKATEMAKATSHKNGQCVEPVVCNLIDPLEERLKWQVDVLLFNPPYVVTPSSEVGSGGITASWAGGVKGREVIDAFLPKVASLLSPQGAFYLVVIKENEPEEIKEKMRELNFKAEVLGSRRAGRECLSIIKFIRAGHFS